MSQDGIVVVSVVSLGPDYDSLYESQLPEISDRLSAASENANPPLLIIDLPQTKFFGSAFLGLLVAISEKLKSRDGRLAVSRLSTYCRVAVEKSKLDKILDIYDSVEDAIASF